MVRCAPCWIVIVVSLTLTGCGDNPNTTRPEPPSGGQEVVLDFDRYAVDVAPVLARNGCSAAGDCHGAGLRGTFQMTPVEIDDVQFDFDQVSAQVDPHDLTGSAILLKPLAESAGGVPHNFKPFSDETDPDYVILRDWVLDGDVQ